MNSKQRRKNKLKKPGNTRGFIKQVEISEKNKGDWTGKQQIIRGKLQRQNTNWK